MSEEFAKIFPSRLQGDFVRFVQTPTQNDKRLIAMMKDGSKRVIQCETCGNTEYMEVELFGISARQRAQLELEADKYYVRCHNPKCSGRRTGLYITAVSSDSKMRGQLRNRFRSS